MQRTIAGKLLELHQGNIVDEETDAIVNAANSRLAGGGGVDGAIHRRGGPKIMAETDANHPNGCPTGSAVVTGAGKLAAKFVIHAVGPVWHGGQRGEESLLASTYRQCLALAQENGCREIAFPAISTGAYGYPIDLAARTAIRVAAEQMRIQDLPTRIRFVLFNAAAYGAFAAALEEILPE